MEGPLGALYLSHSKTELSACDPRRWSHLGLAHLVVPGLTACDLHPMGDCIQRLAFCQLTRLWCSFGVKLLLYCYLSRLFVFARHVDLVLRPFYLNALCQLTPLLNLRPLFFLFGSLVLRPFFALTPLANLRHLLKYVLSFLV